MEPSSSSMICPTCCPCRSVSFPTRMMISSLDGQRVSRCIEKFGYLAGGKRERSALATKLELHLGAVAVDPNPHRRLANGQTAAAHASQCIVIQRADIGEQLFKVIGR